MIKYLLFFLFSIQNIQSKISANLLNRVIAEQVCKSVDEQTEFPCQFYKTLEMKPDGEQLKFTKNGQELIVITLKFEESQIKIHKNDEVKIVDQKLFCFDIESKFNLNNYNYFQCSHDDEEEIEESDIEAVKNTNDMIELLKELTNMLNYIHERTEKTNQVGIKDIISLIKRTNNVDKVDFEQPIAPNEEIEIGKLSVYHIQGTKIELKEQGKDSLFLHTEQGVKFWFRYKTFPLFLFQALIYDASKDFIRLIINSNSQEFDLYINKYLIGEHASPEEYLNHHYLEQINKIFFGILKHEEATQITKKIQLLNEYYDTQLNNFPIAVINIAKIMQTNMELMAVAPITFHPDDVDAEGNIYEQLDIQWIFSQTAPKSYGKIFKAMSIFPQSHQEDIEKNSVVDQNYLDNELNAMLESYQMHLSNFVQLTFGIPDIYRKMIVRLFGYEDEFYKSIQIKFVAQFFESEYVVPLMELGQFHKNISNIIKEVVKHYRLVVLKSDSFSQSKPIEVDTIKKLIQENFNVEGMCVQANEDESLEYKIPPTFFSGEKKLVTTDIAACDENKKLITLIHLKKQDLSEKSGYMLKIFEPQEYDKDGSPRKYYSTDYRFFAEYPYDYESILQDYLARAANHFKEGFAAEIEDDKGDDDLKGELVKIFDKGRV